jgi:hypothetical protein
VKVICTRTGKESFGTLGRAQAYGAFVSQRSGREMRPYPCEFCGCWHLTSHRYDVNRRTRVRDAAQ